ncbi:hypothetical protein [Hydrogenoanaerobacterium sp.]|uniref:hypothetical protein n=1 Tax=Hydrogenoanaerobacterium sp. TaxID=2953763 RepID=UPI0028995A3B|nr:hypothetical protein [Hydrogenoanaerobacterium sp.]
MRTPNKICEDTLCAIFLPRAREEVCRFYKDFLTVKPVVVIDCMKLVNMRHSPSEGSKFILDFDIHPHIGRQVIIAVNRMTVCINTCDGEVSIISFRQLRSFPVPEHLWDVVCQPF